MTTTVELIHAGYIRDDGHVGSSVSLIRDGDAIIVADPGLVVAHATILDPLAERGIAPGDVTHVFLSHHHPDHTMNVGAVPERLGHRLLGEVPRRSLARPRRRRLAPLATTPSCG